jgi:hypothetical protein
LTKSTIIYLKKRKWGEWVILNCKHIEMHRIHTYEVEDAKFLTHKWISSFNINYKIVIVEPKEGEK